MGTFGSNPGSWSTWQWTGWNNENNVAQLFTCPELADVTQLSAFLAGHDGTLLTSLCMWDSGGTLLASTAGITAALGSHSTGGQGWYSGAIGTVRLSAGQQVYLGWWREPATVGHRECEWSTAAGGSFKTYTTANSGGPGGLGTTATYSGSIGAYATYTPVQLGKIFVSSPSNRAWTRPALIRSDAATTTHEYDNYAGATWQQM